MLKHNIPKTTSKDSAIIKNCSWGCRWESSLLRSLNHMHIVRWIIKLWTHLENAAALDGHFEHTWKIENRVPTGPAEPRCVTSPAGPEHVRLYVGPAKASHRCCPCDHVLQFPRMRVIKRKQQCRRSSALHAMLTSSASISLATTILRCYETNW